MLPTEPTTPNVLLSNLPSRPQVEKVSKGKVEARWSPPEGPSAGTAVAYELEWRRCDGEWGDPNSSMKCDDVFATIPSLPAGVYYTFRVRASVDRVRGIQWTEWSPPSAPVLPAPAKQTAKPSGPAKGEAKGKAKGKKDATRAPRAPPVRSEEEATESVIEADLRGVLGGYHPSVQAAVETKLQDVKKQRAQDTANLKTLEDRNKAIASKAREDQLNELVKMKREMLNRALDNGETTAKREPAGPATDSWD